MLWTHAYVLLLALSAPCRISDVDRFPPDIHGTQTYDEGGCSAIRPDSIESRLQWLRLAQNVGGSREWWAWQEQILEQELIDETWQLLWEARVYRSLWADNPEILNCLRQIRERIGEAAYAAGRMPPPIPFHRYRSINP